MGSWFSGVSVLRVWCSHVLVSPPLNPVGTLLLLITVLFVLFNLNVLSSLDFLMQEK